MKCSVTFRHMRKSEALRGYVEEKVDKVTRLIDRGGEAQATLSVEKHLHVAHIELVIDGTLRIRGMDKSEDMYASIDAAVERIIRQVKRYRSKINDHRPSSHGGRELPHRILQGPSIEENEVKVPQVVSKETIVARTMSVDDAVMQLDLASDDFLVFTNAISQRINLVYRMEDGQYGLIEPHAAA